MKQELFNPQEFASTSLRIIYTSSIFAKKYLLHLQEAGSFQALYPHTSKRSDLESFLCFVVLSGIGELKYEGEVYKLATGDCVFIDCRKAYSHSTGYNCDENNNSNLWSLQWCHFYGASLPAIYAKYREHGGKPVFHPKNVIQFTEHLTEIYNLASSSDYICDMQINEKLAALLTMLMEQSRYSIDMLESGKCLEISSIKAYLDEHYVEKITLDNLANQFFINKFYMMKIFKETYGTTIVNYLISKRITRAKQLLRFTDMTMDEISIEVGIDSANYFSRAFHKVEGISPSEYRRKW